MVSPLGNLIGRLRGQSPRENTVTGVVEGVAGGGVAEPDVAAPDTEKLNEARKQLASLRSVTRDLGDELERDPNDPWPLTKLGYNYLEIQELALATETFEKAQVGDPSSYWIRTGLASCYAGVGDLAKAGRIYEALFREGYHRAQVFWSVIQLPTSVENDEILSALSNLKPSPEANPAAFESETAFMKAAVLDKSKRYAEAWAQLVIANDLRKKLQANDGPGAEDPPAVTRTRDTSLTGKEVEAGVPYSLFIMGPSRSGKTTMEALIGARHGVKRGYENVLITDILQALKTTGLFGGGRLSATQPAARSMFGSLYREELAKLKGMSVFTNTTPQMIRDVFELVEAVPNARFVFMKRDIEDVVIKIYMKDYVNDRRTYLYSIDGIYKFVRGYYEQVDYFAEMLPDVARVVRYEDMVDDPRAVADVTADLCGLSAGGGELRRPWDDRGVAEPYRDFMRTALAGS